MIHPGTRVAFCSCIAILMLISISIFTTSTSGADGQANPSNYPISSTIGSQLSLNSIQVPNQPSESQAAGPLNQFYYGLWQDFPSTFGGLVVNPNGSYTVLETGADPVFESAAQSRFDTIPTQLGVSVAANLLQLSFRQVPFSRSQLQSTRDAIVGQISSKQLAPTIVAAGIDELNDRVIVLDTEPEMSVPLGSVTPTASTASQEDLAASYDPSMLEFQHSGAITTTSRDADSPPWNGGDLNTSSISTCTSGPGVHITGGGHALLSRGSL